MIRKTLSAVFLFWQKLLDKAYGDVLSIDHPVASGTLSVYLAIALACLLAFKMQQPLYVFLPAAVLAAFANWYLVFPLFIVFVWGNLTVSARKLWDELERREENSKLGRFLSLAAFLSCAVLAVYFSYRIAALMAADVKAVSNAVRYLAWPLSLSVGTVLSVLLCFISWALIDSLGLLAVAGVSSGLLLYFLKESSTQVLIWLGLARECLPVLMLLEFVLYACYIFPLLFLALSPRNKS